jgi:hypothetical protein
MRIQSRGGRRMLPYLAALSVALAFAAPVTAQQPAPAPAPAPATPEMKDLPLTPEQRQSYVANYSVTTPEGTMVFRIYEEGGVLKGAPADDEPKRLLYQGDHVFQPEGLPGFSLTFTMEGARAAKFVVKSPEWTLEGVRMP